MTVENNVTSSIDSTIRRLKVHRHSDAEIAKQITDEYGVPHTADKVCLRIQTLMQMSMRSTWTWAQDELLLLLAETGMTARDIAKAFAAGPRPGTNRNAVIGRANRLHIRFGTPSCGPPRREAYVKPEPEKPVPKVKPRERVAFNQCRRNGCTNTRAIPYEECVPCREKIRLAKKEAA